MRGKFLNHCCYGKKTPMCYTNLLQSNLYVISMLLLVQANRKGAEGCLYFFLFFLSCKVIGQFPPARN